MKIIVPTSVTEGSFSRASSATYINSAGVLTTAANDVFRIGYNTPTPTAVVEAASTNLFTYSGDFSNAVWPSGGATKTANSIVAPDSTTTACKFDDTGASGTPSNVARTFVATAIVTSISFYTKAGTATTKEFSFYNQTSSLAMPTYTTTFNYATGVSSNSLWKVETLINGWYRLSVTLSITSGATYRFHYGRSGSAAVGNTDTWYMWGAQWEVGSTTSYIPTTTTAATRADDIVSGSLLYSNITEPQTSYPTWSNAPNYAIGAKVTRLHRIYEAARASAGIDPSTDVASPPYWVDVGPTNRHAMFDSVVGTITSSTTSNITVVVKGSNLNGMSFMEVGADKIQISVTDGGTVQYSNTLNLTSGVVTDWFEYFNSPITRIKDYALTNAPNLLNSIVTVVFSSTSGTVTCGNLVLGNVFVFDNGTVSATASSAKVGVTDYSVKTVDAFGNVKVTLRGFAKRMSLNLMISSPAVDTVAAKLASVRGTPCVWIASDNIYQSMIVYGYYKDWEIDIAYTTKSYCSLTIEGLT